MTALPQHRTPAITVNCEVRCPGSDEVVGYVEVGGLAGSLEQALTEHGFWLVPVGPRAELEPTPVAA